MTRIFTTGAEEADISALWDAVDAIDDGNKNQQSLAFGNYEFGGNSPRTGRGMYHIGQQGYLKKDFGTDVSNTELFFGFAMRFPVIGNIDFFYAFTDAPSTFSNFLSLQLNATGAVEVTRTNTIIATSAGGVVSVNTWHYFEVWFKPLNSDGRAVVKVDGTTVIDFTGDTTHDLELINAFQFLGVAAASLGISTFYDDIVVNTSGGAVNNTYPGMVRLLPIRPDAPGTNSDWTRAGVDLGSDEAQLRNGTWEFSMLQTASADALQDAIPEIPDLPAGATITNIVLTANAKVDAGAGVIAPMVIANGTSDISADQTLVSTWRHYQYAWAVNPEDSAA